ncbi:hypothetical protein BaRGS_00009206 [Batillaria attramentaria]|uniref:Uncharacterized protein n=1 Tax=Batillaria attramentaria TaxID=370345 RepID=A0ABD0LKS7_9CAEN
MCGKEERHQQMSEEDRQSIFQSFCAFIDWGQRGQSEVPSHYCSRQSTSTVHLRPRDYSSLTDVFTAYTKWLSKEHPDVKPLSATPFRNIIDNENVDIWHPRKDQCDTCIAHAKGNVPPERYQEHIQRKQT